MVWFASGCYLIALCCCLLIIVLFCLGSFSCGDSCWGLGLAGLLVLRVCFRLCGLSRC